jgi:hypothetical protein
MSEREKYEGVAFILNWYLLGSSYGFWWGLLASTIVGTFYVKGLESERRRVIKEVKRGNW